MSFYDVPKCHRIYIYYQDLRIKIYKRLSLQKICKRLKDYGAKAPIVLTIVSPISILVR